LMNNLETILNELREGNDSPESYSEQIRKLSLELRADQQSVVAACDKRISELHRGQARGDGAPYVIHPRRVALIAAELCEGAQLFEVILVSLLHDVVEDCDVALSEIEHEYGAAVARAVGLLSAPRVEGEGAQGRRSRKEAKLEQVEQAGGLTLLVYFADNLDNVISWRNLGPLSDAFQKLPRWLWQAKNWYIPLAQRQMPSVAVQIMAEVEFELGRGATIGSWGGA
jgi:(p)ppGpp synthase/HD superfamily hydrolase